MRRRIALIAAVGTLIVAALSSWGLGRLAAAVDNREASIGIVSLLTIVLAFVFTVVVALGAASLASPAISSDVEGGIVLSILPRPLSRTQFVIGKWLGIVTLVGTYVAVFGGVELLGIRIATGYAPPNPLGAIAYLVAQSVVLVSIAILFSTRLPAVAGGLLSVLSFGIAWIAGIAGAIADQNQVDSVRTAATITSLIIPSDGLWHGVAFSLQPVAVAIGMNASGHGAENPFGGSAGPSIPFLIWTAFWVAGVLALSAASFARRDV